MKAEESVNPPKKNAPKKWKVWLKRIIWGVVVLMLVASSVIAFENWRGRKSWETYQKEAEVRGLKMTLKSAIPPMIPHESNVASIPILAALFDYKNDTNGEVQWTESNLVKRVMSVNSAGGFGNISSREGNPNWVKANPANLEQIEASLLKSTDPLPPLTKQSTPAKTLLAAIAAFEPELMKLQEGFKRTHVRFPVHYEEGFVCQLPHLAVLRGFSRLALLKSTAFLAENKIEDASTQILFSLRFGEVVGTNPLLISSLVQLAMDSMSISGIYEGILAHQWSEIQLKQFENELRQRDPLSLLQQSLQLERAMSNEYYDQLRQGSSPAGMGEIAKPLKLIHGISTGMLYQNQLRQNRFCDSIDILSIRKKGLTELSIDMGMDQLSKGFWPYRALAAMLAPAIESCVKKSIRGRVSLDIAMLACALERFHLSKKHYPESLNELIPEFVKEIPPDAASGGALHYLREPGNHFMLYSVGSDLEDDKGDIGKGEKGDWVWKWPGS